MATKLNLEKAEKRDITKYCHFHEDHGHMTEECKQLKDEIKRLIRDVTLWKFTRKGREERKPKPKEPTPKITPDQEHVGVIHITMEGPKDDQGK